MKLQSQVKWKTHSFIQSSLACFLGAKICLFASGNDNMQNSSKTRVDQSIDRGKQVKDEKKADDNNRFTYDIKDKKRTVTKMLNCKQTNTLCY